MKLNAYVLAADPAWIEVSVLSYYDIVDRIVVSYDIESRGWTGAPVDVEQCLRRLRAIDRAGKCEYRPGHFARPDFFKRPMQNDTYQRQVALDQASDGADWVLQFDSDEVAPRIGRLIEVLRKVNDEGYAALEWPMRVLFRRLGNGEFLEVCSRGGADRFDYPGPVAVRPGARLQDARRAEGSFLRVIVHGDTQSLQLQRAPSPGEVRREWVDPSDAIIHNSWARRPTSIRSKVASWSHHEGWRSRLFYTFIWRPAPVTWRWLRNFHPLHPPLWPALKPCITLPKGMVWTDD